jgi:hypothetical protein
MKSKAEESSKRKRYQNTAKVEKSMEKRAARIKTISSQFRNTHARQGEQKRNK